MDRERGDEWPYFPIVGKRPALDPITARRVYEWGQFARTQAQLARKLGISRSALRVYLKAGHKRRYG